MRWESSVDVSEYHLEHQSSQVVPKSTISNYYHLLIRSLLGDEDAIVLDSALHLLTRPAQPLPHFTPANTWKSRSSTQWLPLCHLSASGTPALTKAVRVFGGG